MRGQVIPYITPILGILKIFPPLVPSYLSQSCTSFSHIQYTTATLDPWYLTNSFQLWAVKLPILSLKMFFLKLQMEVPPWHSAFLREVFAHAIWNNAPLCPLTVLCLPPITAHTNPSSASYCVQAPMKYLHCRLSRAWISLLLIFAYFITVKITLNEKPILEAFHPLRRYSH